MYISTPGQVEFRDIDKPIRQKGEVLLKLLYGEICGSDLGSYERTFTHFDYPRIPGHELSAEIAEMDEDNEQGLRPEMIVAYNPYFSCGHCYSCEHRIVNVCMDNQTMGCQRDGAFQEYITMPEERVYDRKGLDPMLLVAIEPFCINYRGVSRAEVKLGDRVLIIGVSTIGAPAAVAAKAKRTVVYTSDVSTRKLGMARELGMDGVILNDSPEGFDRTVKEITGGDGFDIAIEATGLPSTFQNCIGAACFGGKVIIIGVGKRNLDFNFTLFQKKKLNVFGSGNTLKKGFAELIDLVKEGKVPVREIITNMYRLEDGVKAFNGFANNPGNMLKVILDFTDR